MSNDSFEYEIYRLNIFDSADTFEFYGEPLRADSDITAVVKETTNKKYDEERDYEKSTYKWSLRGFVDFGVVADHGNVLCVTIARSPVEQTGPVVGDDEIETKRSRFENPVAQTMRLFFLLSRHLVIVEHNSSLLSTHAWRNHIQAASGKASGKLGFKSELVLEPRPIDQEVLRALNEFSKLTALKVHLRIPNPEISRDAKYLYDTMDKQKIREMILDMRNPSGLATGANTLVRSSSAMADAGYKDGPVKLIGYKPNSNKIKKVTVGRNAARDSIPNGRSVLSAASPLRKSAYSREILNVLFESLSRLLPK